MALGLRAAKGSFPYNPRITVAKADKIIALFRTKGIHWLIDYAHHHNMTRQQMRDFIERNCSEPVPKDAA